MASSPYDRIVDDAKRLSPEERLLLIERLARSLRDGQSTTRPAARWEDQAGTAPYPLCGEDAQVWVSRTRAESDRDRSSP
jgi:hypothetical protein